MLSIIVNESKKIFFCVFKYSEQTNIYFPFIDQILIYKKNILKNPDIITIYIKGLVPNPAKFFYTLDLLNPTYKA